MKSRDLLKYIFDLVNNPSIPSTKLRKKLIELSKKYYKAIDSSAKSKD